MELNKGFINSEVGALPVDWVIKKIRDVCMLVNGRGFKPYEWKKEGLPIIRIQNLNGSDDFNYYQGPYEKKLEIEKGQLLFAWSGSRGTSFGPHIWNGSKGLLNYHTWKVNVNEQAIDKNYFLHSLKQLTKDIEDKAHGASALVHTQKWEMEGYPFACPPTKAEQTAIATALSDTDALITGLEKLIAKKRNIKQGAMQELLFGKERLPGFTEPWVEKSIHELAERKKELFDDGDWIESEFLTNDGVRLIQTGNIGEGSFITKETKKYISFDSFKYLRCKEVRAGDILICRLAEPAGRACIVPDLKEQRMITSVDVSIFRPPETSADRFFLISLFSTKNWLNVVSEKCGGSTRTRIARGALGKIKISLPPIDEQVAISTILKEMDDEVISLEAKLEKLRTVKQGMMQTLLTGKIRLL